MYREAGNGHFVHIKSGGRRNRGRFDCRLHRQFGTGVDEYDDLTACIVSLLPAQSDYDGGTAQAGERSEISRTRKPVRRPLASVNPIIAS